MVTIDPHDTNSGICQNFQRYFLTLPPIFFWLCIRRYYMGIITILPLAYAANTATYLDCGYKCITAVKVGIDNYHIMSTPVEGGG